MIDARIGNEVTSIQLRATRFQCSRLRRHRWTRPFPDRTFTSGLRQMIALIPLTGKDPGAAIGRTAMAARLVAKFVAGPASTAK